MTQPVHWEKATATVVYKPMHAGMPTFPDLKGRVSRLQHHSRCTAVRDRDCRRVGCVSLRLGCLMAQCRLAIALGQFHYINLLLRVQQLLALQKRHEDLSERRFHRSHLVT